MPAFCRRTAEHGPGFGQPLEADRRVLYHIEETDAYYEFIDSNWQEADARFVSQVLGDKAYIDNPNELYRAFLNPRNIHLGIRLSF